MILKPFIACCILLLCYSDSFSQWEWVNNPISGGYDNLAIEFVNDSTGFILNANHDLLKTVDQGNSWHIFQNNFFTTQTINYFPHESFMEIKDSTGIISGTGGTLYVSHNNGNTWNTVNTGINADLYRISIVSRDTIFIQDYSGNLYETVDRAATWKLIPLPPYALVSAHGEAFNFANSKIGYVSSLYGLLKTTDGGNTWQDYNQIYGSPTGRQTFRIQCFNKDTCFILREFDLLSTYDGGNTWQEFYPPDPLWNPPIEPENTQLFFVNAAVGYVGGEGGMIVKTIDSGKTWTNISLPHIASVTGMYFITPIIGFAITDNGNGIAKTEDGSITPTHVDSLQIISNAGCAVSVQAKLSTLNEIDSVTFELRNKDDGTMQVVSGSPNNVIQGSTISTAQFKGLISKDYSVHVRYYNNGTYYYSDSLDFIANTYPKPTIYLDSVNVFHSSVTTGNQWYLNSQAISGATAQEYAPAQSGTYSDIITRNGCNSIMSDTFYFTKDVQSSFSLLSNGGCSITAEDSLSTTGRIDYVSFQLNNLDDGSFASSIGTPYVVARGSINSMVQFPAIQGKNYTISALYAYNRISHYSDSIRFTAAGYQTPSVYVDSMHVLHSSSGFGNQWYFNGQAITGANGELYTPTESGNYSVMISQNGCNSALSNSVYFLKTDLGVTLNPNPSHDFFYLYNTQNRALFYEIVNVNGKVVASGILSSTDTKISTTNLNTGQYFIRIADKNTAEKITIPFIKL